MTRARLILTFDGMRGPVDRLLEWLREGGYTVDDPQQLAGREGYSGRDRIVVEVQAPHGEVDARPHYLGPPSVKRR